MTGIATPDTFLHESIEGIIVGCEGECSIIGQMTQQNQILVKGTQIISIQEYTGKLIKVPVCLPFYVIKPEEQVSIHTQIPDVIEMPFYELTTVTFGQNDIPSWGFFYQTVEYGDDFFDWQGSAIVIHEKSKTICEQISNFLTTIPKITAPETQSYTRISECQEYKIPRQNS